MKRYMCWFALPLALMMTEAPLALAEEAAKAGDSSQAGPGPVFSDTGPDAEVYGAAAGFPVGDRAVSSQLQHLVATYSHFGEIFPSRPVPRAATPWLFKRAPEPSISYTFRSDRLSIQDYLGRNPTTGLLIAKDDTILYEHYQYARTDRDRFLSQSMAKTITAMLIGIAVSEGKIKSIDDPVSAYVPGLATAEYGNTSIRSLLHMSSGVAFTEVYDGNDDIAKLSRDLFTGSGKDPVGSVAQFNTRVAPAGTRWHYASVETEILGLVLRAVTGGPVADYLRDRIWQPIGAEADASWAIDGTGQEITFCCFNAVLRDYARFGRLLAHDGAWEGRQVIPRQWLLDATTVLPADTYLAPKTATPYFGYGYQVWLLPGEAVRAAGNPRADNPGRSCLQARHGAHSRAPEAGGAGLLCGDNHTVVQRACTAGKIVGGHPSRREAHGSTDPARIIPLSGKHGRICLLPCLAAADPMRHDRAENSESRTQSGVNREAFVKRITTGIVATILAMSATAVLAQSKPPLKLGGILDMSSLYADITGPGSEMAAKMAVEDFGGEVLGRKIEILAADHQNKADLSANIARDMLDNQGVEMIYDVAASATALAAGEIAKARNKIIMFNGPGSIRLSNEACGPYTIHYVFDTFGQANVTGLAAVKQGLDSWYFLTADYAFGQDLEKDTTNVVLKSGGKVLGAVRHPLNTSDFSSFLLQAQASKAKVIGLANAGGDTVNGIKQAAEFGLMKGGQKVAPLLAFVTDIDSIGLETAQGLLLSEAFYWDLNDDTRAFSKRFQERIKRVPTSAQAGVYSSVMHYLKAVKQAGTTDAAAVIKIMKETPINDMFAKNGKIREDGRMVHDMYLFEVKKPSESKARWDYYKLLTTIPGNEAFQSLESSRCPLVKK